MTGRNEDAQQLNRLSAEIVDCAVQVHRNLGPGLLERVYTLALVHELEKKGLATRTQVPVEVVYEGQALGEGFRADVIVELKSVARLEPVHSKQLLTYLRLTGLKLGLLLNFNEALMKDGIVRVVNGMVD